MRELKFRAWDKRDKTWHFGNCNYLMDLSGRLMWDFGSEPPQHVDQDEFEIVQFTGLKDKNSKDIFEGDIIYVSGIGNMAVEWNPHTVGFHFYSTKEGNCGSYDYQDIIEDLEHVIGNIHENPELLEKAKHGKN